MKALVVEDDFTSRLLLQEILKAYGEVHIAVNGKEALKAVYDAMDAGEPYGLVCLDIMMPEMNGYEALQEIRATEKARGVAISRGVKVIITTALDSAKNIVEAFHSLCDAYLVKPISKPALLGQMRTLGLID
jgi:two-component system chemotaxis response regulator CheY